VPAPVFYLTSFFEDASLSQIGDGETSGFPLLCLEDRDEGGLWKGTATSGTRRIIGNNASAGAVDSLILAEGHSFSGIPLTVESSPDGTTYTTKATITPADGHRARFAVTADTKPWWRLSWSTGGAAYLGEAYLTLGQTTTKVPSQDGTIRYATTPVALAQTRSARILMSRLGLQRWGMKYVYTRVADADRQVIASAEAMGKPFYLADHNGALHLVYFSASPEYARTFGSVDVWTIEVSLAEVEALV
jgi:hypothetical protein